MKQCLRFLIIGQDERLSQKICSILTNQSPNSLLVSANEVNFNHELLFSKPWDAVVFLFARQNCEAVLQSMLRVKTDGWMSQPIVVVSDVEGDDFAVRALRAGANDYVLARRLDSELLPVIEQKIFEFATLKLRQAQAFVDSERSKIYSLFMQAPVAICMIEGPHQIYTLANASYLKLVNNRDVLGKTVHEAFPELEGQGIFERLAQVYETGEPYRGSEVCLGVRQPDGSLDSRCFDFVWDPWFGHDGKVRGIVVVAHDVSERVEARKKIEEALSTRDEFMSIASHELRTPITSLKLQLQVMYRKIKPDINQMPNVHKLWQMLGLANKQVVRLTELVEDLLDVSRIQSGRVEYVMTEFPLSLMINDVIERFTEELRSSGNKIVLKLDPAIRVVWDYSRFEQVLVNLITNSIKYAPSTPIEIRTYLRDGIVRLTFEDNGPGIRRERHNKIFERYERATSSKKISGLGLGLYIVSQIIHGHRGTIRLQSDEGMGARFIMQIPVDAKNIIPEATV